MLTALIVTLVVCITFIPEIKAYCYSKKSPEQKYAAYRKFMNEWNGTNYQ